MGKPEVWLRGPLANIPPLLQPVAHALLQAREEINALMAGFPDELLWAKPAGLASAGFHLQHLSGVLNRLFTYARAQQLNQQQLEALAAEGKPGDTLYYTAELVELFNRQVDGAIDELSHIDEATLKDYRDVGRGKLPSTVMGLYVHSAEHTMRHAGQLLVTVRVLLDN